MSKIKKKISLTIVVALIVLSLVGCSSGGDDNDENTEITLLSGRIAEAEIMMQAVGILIEENTDLKVNFHDSMSTVAGANANISGDVDLYIAYDGTLLTTILGYDPSDVPEGEELFDWTKKKGVEEKGLTMTEKIGFENTYALAIREEFAEENNIVTISDLLPYTQDMIFGAEHAFFDDEGTARFNPFVEHYGIEWKDSKSLELGLIYSAIDNGNIDATMSYTTDGLNVKSNLRVLEDDKDFFPEYYASFLVRDTLFEEYAETAPNLEEILNSFTGLIDNQTMTQMNYRVDAQGADPKDVAKEFLVEVGLSE